MTNSTPVLPLWLRCALVLALAVGLTPPLPATAQDQGGQEPRTGVIAYGVAAPAPPEEPQEPAEPDASEEPTDEPAPDGSDGSTGVGGDAPPAGMAVADIDGTDGKALTDPGQGGVDRFPRWAPDGQWLAFTRNDSTGRRPLAVSADGTTIVELAQVGWHATWNAEGNQLAWATRGATPGIIVQNVATEDGQLVLGEQRLIPTRYRADGPVFSPSGTTIAFRMRRGPNVSGADLWTVDVDGTDLRQVTRDVNLAAGPADGHAWSPDSRMLTVLAADAASRGGQRGHIVNRDGTGRRLLYPRSGCEFTREIVWAPHGEFVALLQSCQEEGFQLVTPAGELVGVVGAGPVAYGGVDFSSDGADLFATSRPSDTKHGAAVVRIPLDGSPSVVVAQTPAPAMAAVDVAVHGEVVPEVVRPPRDEKPDPGDETDAKRRRPLLELACPLSEVPYADFLDVNLGSAHRVAIDCMAWWDVASGTGEHAFSPNEPVTRAQMASFLARMIVAGGGELPNSTIDYFDDDRGSPHERNINRLAKAGIVRGSADRRFRPYTHVRRDQMASLVIASYRYLHPQAAPVVVTDYFIDDERSVHEDAINAAAEEGFVTGVGGGAYAPDRSERRSQAASRAARVLDALVEAGYVVPPREGLARVTKVVDGDTVLANDPVDGTVRVRFVGINATETGTCGAEAATAALRDLVGGKTIRLYSDDPSSIGHKERPLRFVEVYGENGWMDVNREQLAQGHALWFPNEQGKEPRNNNDYQRAAREARRNDRGVWDNTACGVGPQQGAKLKLWVRANPEGPDTADINGEWVRIANRGTNDVDLSGWALRDASARKPYEFPAGSVVPAGSTMTVHVGEGIDEPLTRYMGRRRPLFANAHRVDGQWVGDGAYLLDGDGDIREDFMYPCIGTCSDPLLDKVRISRVIRGADAEDAGGEVIVLRNISKETLNLHGYRLVAPGGSFDLPEGASIAPADRLRVRVASGTDSARVTYWPSSAPVLDTDDGLVLLRTYDGITVACHAWGATVC